MGDFVAAASNKLYLVSLLDGIRSFRHFYSFLDCPYPTAATSVEVAIVLPILPAGFRPLFTTFTSPS